MSARELVVLGTASQAPTRSRNHNGYLLRWDGHGFLFDPGEGTQRQLLLAGVPSSAITRICLTHFRLRYASSFHEVADLWEHPVAGDGVLTTGPDGALEARRLDHPVEAFGYRFVEPDGRRMLPEFDGEVVVAEDLARVPMPARRG